MANQLQQHLDSFKRFQQGNQPKQIMDISGQTGQNINNLSSQIASAQAAIQSGFMQKIADLQKLEPIDLLTHQYEEKYLRFLWYLEQFTKRKKITSYEAKKILNLKELLPMPSSLVKILKEI